MGSEAENEKGISRRDFIKETAAGSVVAAASSALAGNAPAEASPGAESEGISVETYNTYGADLEKMMFLKTT